MAVKTIGRIALTVWVVLVILESPIHVISYPIVPYDKIPPNILAAGRIISAEGEGWQITRVIPVRDFWGRRQVLQQHCVLNLKCQ